MNFQELHYASIALRVFLAMGIGGFIGLERESKNQPAGSRTYMLVCVGACLVMMTNQYICWISQDGDPSRLGAQVVSGIGFLGAGTILVTKNNQVRGLTTAAGLWASACIGLAVGIGFYEGALTTGAVLLVIMTVCKSFDARIRRRSRYIRIYLNFVSNDGLNCFVEQCRRDGIKILDMQILKAKGEDKGGMIVMLSLKSAQKYDHIEFVRRMSEIEEIRCIEEI